LAAREYNFSAFSAVVLCVLGDLGFRRGVGKNLEHALASPLAQAAKSAFLEIPLE